MGPAARTGRAGRRQPPGSSSEEVEGRVKVDLAARTGRAGRRQPPGSNNEEVEGRVKVDLAARKVRAGIARMIITTSDDDGLIDDGRIHLPSTHLVNLCLGHGDAPSL